MSGAKRVLGATEGSTALSQKRTGLRKGDGRGRATGFPGERL